MAVSSDRHGGRAEPRLNAALDQETEASWSSPERPELGRPARRRGAILWLLLLVVLLAGAACYYLWRKNASQPVAAPPPVKASAPAETAPEARLDQTTCRPPTKRSWSARWTEIRSTVTFRLPILGMTSPAKRDAARLNEKRWSVRVHAPNQFQE